MHQCGDVWCMRRSKLKPKVQDAKVARLSLRVSVSFTPEQYEFLSRLAETKRVSTAWVVRDAVEKLVAQEGTIRASRA